MAMARGGPGPGPAAEQREHGATRGATVGESGIQTLSLTDAASGGGHLPDFWGARGRRPRMSPDVVYTYA